MRIYNIRNDYVEFLKRYDAKVPDNKNERRPYVGVVLEIGNVSYYAPLSSPKSKHKKMKNGKDFRKINHGIYGAINFNNMIPVNKLALISIDFRELEDEKYKRLLQNQYRYIREDSKQIEKTAQNLHDLVFTEDEQLNDNDKRIKQRCCNLPLLEKVVANFCFSHQERN